MVTIMVILVVSNFVFAALAYYFYVTPEIREVEVEVEPDERLQLKHAFSDVLNHMIEGFLLFKSVKQLFVSGEDKMSYTLHVNCLNVYAEMSQNSNYSRHIATLDKRGLWALVKRDRRKVGHWDGFDLIINEQAVTDIALAHKDAAAMNAINTNATVKVNGNGKPRTNGYITSNEEPPMDFPIDDSYYPDAIYNRN